MRICFKLIMTCIAREDTRILRRFAHVYINMLLEKIQKIKFY